MLIFIGIISILVVVWFIVFKRRRGITIKPITIFSRDFKNYTVKDLKRIIEDKLLSGEITENTKLFLHVYTEDGEAVEFPEICIDTVDGLDFDADERELVKYISEKQKSDACSEEELDKLVEQAAENIVLDDELEYFYYTRGFKAGYRKAEESEI